MATRVRRERYRNISGERCKEAIYQGLAEGWSKGLGRVGHQISRCECTAYVTGRRSKITILDIDTTEAKIAEDAILRHGQPVIVIRTASGKRHHLYRYNGERRRIRPHRAMGGFGSGRRSGSAQITVESCQSIDVNVLRREGCLQLGCRGSQQWLIDGARVASIGLRAGREALHLSYDYRGGGGEWEDVAETIRIAWVPCCFGGARPERGCLGSLDTERQ